MRIRIEKISLAGTTREFEPKPGLNIIGGSITTGKTTLIKCFRGLLGSKLNNFSREAREHISNLVGKVVIGEQEFEILRPFVTTNDAKVSIAGEEESWRLPALRSPEGEPTYGTWLLEKLGLPVLRVPNAPTKADSDTSLLSINDYLTYCHLSQDEIDSSVFEHTNTFKNIKRKYVFEVIYGKYDVEIAQLQEERRNVISEIRRLSNYGKTVGEFLDGTPFENRASIQRDLDGVNGALQEASTNSIRLSHDISQRSDTNTLRERLLQLRQEIMNAQAKLQFEEYGLIQKEKLVAQLRTQGSRLTKAIVAGSYLLDFDFMTCPRCGSEVDSSSTDPEVCYLCHQTPEPQITQADLIKEEKRIESQVSETNELVETHRAVIPKIKSKLEGLEEEERKISGELDSRTQRYVSEQADRIAELAQHRTHLQEKQRRLEEYLQLFNRQDQAITDIAQLETRLEELNTAIDLANSRVSQFNEYLAYLDSAFQNLLEEIEVPDLPNPGESVIDRKTYLPIFQGRRFEELQSQGLKVMVNIAHALAHQLTCMHFELSLPNILIIDGLSDNIGSQDFDLARIQSIYSCLTRISNEYGERLQIIVSDNTVQEAVRGYVLVEFDDNNKLIPLAQLQGESA